MLISSMSFGQTSYSGFIDKYPIELFLQLDSDGKARAIYTYTNHDDPISITGKLTKGTLTIYEKNQQRKNIATLTFINFDEKNATNDGIWTNLETLKEFKITLTKRFAIEIGDEFEWGNREITQSTSSKNQYFRLVTSKKKGEFYARATSLKIIEKKSDKLIQTFNIDCKIEGFDNVYFGDFNFDGIKDIAIFQDNYTGTNTTSLYFLFDQKINKYIDSKFQGVSLEFDDETKTIFERNTCCQGRTETNATYKIVKNKMVLIEQHCYKWDDKTQELVERKMKDCQ
jgi:hypothetical protein